MTRRNQRGATVFIVVMAITLLTAVGLFAAHSATLVDQAAGYARMARQTQYLAEYGTLASVTELGSGAADAYVEALKRGADTCLANANRTGVGCYRMTYDDLNQRTQALSGESLSVDQAGSVADVIGYTGTGAPGMSGYFSVELTDIAPTGMMVAGNRAGENTYVRVTATTTAQLRPAGSACTNAVTTLSSQQSMRAYLIVGPL